MHPAVRAWRLLSPGRDGPSRVDALEESRARGVLRLVAAGSDGSDVIARRFNPRGPCLERRIYEEVLPRLPIRGLHFHGAAELEGEGWLFLEDAGGERYSAQSSAHRALAARWLALVHLGSARLGVGATLPDAGPGHFLELLRRARTGWEREGAGELLEPTLARLDLLEEHWDLIETWCEGMPRTLVHGDFVGRNLRVRGGPDRSELVPCGWESAGWGVPAIDLAQASLQAKRLAAAPDLAAYASLLRAYGCGVSDEVVFRVSVCGKVFRCLAGLSQNKSAHHLRIYGSELAEAMGERGLSFCRSAPAPRAAASPG